MTDIIQGQKADLPTYINYITNDIYCGDRIHPEDINITHNIPPFTGGPYKYLIETDSWILHNEKQWDIIRNTRDSLIVDFRWRIDRQKDLIDLGKSSSDSLIPLLQYVQILRDIPQTQMDPFSITWPELPN